MTKNKLVVFLIFIILCSGCVVHEKKEVVEEDSFKESISAKELLLEETVGFNSIQVYQRNRQLVINVDSEGEFFDGAHFIIPTNKELNASDITLNWSGLFGEVDIEDQNKIILDISILENQEVIFEERINFLEKGMEALSNGMKS